ncbi:MAG: hypothetical protein IT439_08605 [Phycisphaerales bacterium]|nr:hypothetical protein [Phycisphaerales bacterium]
MMALRSNSSEPRCPFPGRGLRMARLPAFSLIEVIIGIAMLTALSGVLWTFLIDLRRQKESLSERGASLHASEVLFERLESDLAGCIAGTPSLGGGVKGTNDEITLLARGVTPPLRSGSIPAGDLQGSAFRFDAKSGTLFARRWDALGAQPDTEWEVVGEGFARVRFRYHDGRGWRETFDASQAGLPGAIEVAVWLRTAEPAPAPEPDAPPPIRPAPRRMTVHADDGPDEAPLADASLPEEQEGEPELPPPPAREPDRVRVMVVPDGPRGSIGGAP